jgi:predicted RNA methylase
METAPSRSRWSGSCGSTRYSWLPSSQRRIERRDLAGAALGDARSSRIASFTDVTTLHRYVPSRVRRAYRSAHRVAGRLVDRWLGIDTADEVRLERLGLAAPERVGYEPSGWLTLRRILRTDEVSPADVFLDLGCGKGRAVLLAARYPFRRVIGVELSDRLTSVARNNVAACRARLRCGSVELVNADVTTYRVPDDVSVVYMNNAFRGSIFDAAMRNLIASVDRQPRTVRLIYSNARDHDRLMRTGRFQLVRASSGARVGSEWRAETAIRLYALKPVARPAVTHQAEPTSAIRGQ